MTKHESCRLDGSCSDGGQIQEDEPSKGHEEMFYVRPSDAEKLVREIERLRVEMGQLATDHLRAQHRAAKENIRLRAIVADWERNGTMCNFSLNPCGNCLGCVQEQKARKAAAPMVWRSK